MMKRKVLATILAATMALGMMTGCGSSSQNAAASKADEAKSAVEESVAGSETSAAAETGTTDTAGAKPFTFAVPFAESGLISFSIFRSNCVLVEEVTGGEIINAAGDLTADGVLSFVEAQCAAGVDGLIICPPTDSILPTVASICEEAGVYWGITLRSIADEDIKNLVEASPYYVGNCYEDEITAGYTCGKYIGEQGWKKIAIFSQTKGDTTTDAREVGLAQACDEFDIEIVGESRGNTQAADITSATESFLAANPDLDCIFYVGTGVIGAQESIVKAIQDAGRDEVKLVGVDFPDQMTADFESGIMTYAYAQVNLTYDCFITMMKVINSIQGTPINDDGTPSSNTMKMIGIDNAEDAAAYNELLGNPEYLFYSKEELPQLCKWINPDLTQESLQTLIDGYTVQ